MGLFEGQVDALLEKGAMIARPAKISFWHCFGHREHSRLVALQAGHRVIALALHERFRVVDKSRLLRRKALAEAKGVGALKAVHGRVKAALGNVRRHDVPHGGDVVRLCDRIMQAFPVEFDAVAEEHGRGRGSW